ncbi:hypothetical protein NECAME_00627 [Necator americanus]|uniref:Uncharacterized protein n=1 Tax=Necator americanus TaxID=51031 RepID=W2T1V6_NECAM|nr:hypothetical protein NECAME_00627 [Necator americanus]ETN75216.1 hypothetical protein NECAME_00627 [Necator americanus]
MRTASQQHISRPAMPPEPQRTALLLPGLPELDFVKLEEQLTNAAREREEHDRRLLGEEIAFHGSNYKEHRTLY